MIKKPITTEKAIRMVEVDNVLLFEVDGKDNKKKIKADFEKMFKVKVVKINTLNKLNKKFAYITLDKKNPAIDVATKLGMI